MDTRKARENAYLLIYELEIRGGTSESVLELFFATENFGEKTRNYVKQMVLGVSREREKLDAQIEEFLKDWKIERISKLSLAAIRLAMFEIENNANITPAIAISEAVGLIAKFEGEEASSFVNGVLGQYAKSK